MHFLNFILQTTTRDLTQADAMMLRKRIDASFCVLSQICDLRYLDFVIYRNLSTWDMSISAVFQQHFDFYFKSETGNRLIWILRIIDLNKIVLNTHAILTCGISI